MGFLTKVFSEPLTRYDLYCLSGLLIAFMAAASASLAFLIIELTKRHMRDNDFKKSLSKNKFFKISDKLVKDVFVAKKLDKEYLEKKEFNKLTFSFGGHHDICVTLEAYNNKKSGVIRFAPQSTAVEYLNRFTDSDDYAFGAKALLIGPNQCGKSHLADKYCRSIKGVTFVVKIDANDFDGYEKTNALANLLRDQVELIEKNNKKGQRVNFVLKIDEFDKKNSHYEDFNLDIASFKKRIFDEIFDKVDKKSWFIPHLIITANNEKKFDYSLTYGVSDDRTTLLTRIPSKFPFRRLDVIGDDKLIDQVIDDLFLDSGYKKDDISSKKNEIKKNIDEKKEMSITVTMREIVDAFNAVMFVPGQGVEVTSVEGDSKKVIA